MEEFSFSDNISTLFESSNITSNVSKVLQQQQFLTSSNSLQSPEHVKKGILRTEIPSPQTTWCAAGNLAGKNKITKDGPKTCKI